MDFRLDRISNKFENEVLLENQMKAEAITVLFTGITRNLVHFFNYRCAIALSLFLSGTGYSSSKQISPGVSDKRPVMYAGFAFTGRDTDIGTNFRYSKVVHGDGKRGKLDRIFYEFFIRNKDRLSNKLIFRGEDIDDKATSIQMTVALTQELVARDRIGDRHKLVINLIFQIMFLDFESKEIMGTFPLSVEWIDSSKHAFDENKIVNLVDRIYTGEIPVLHKALRERLSDVRLKARLGANIRLYSVTIKDRCREVLPGRFLEENRIKDAYNNLVAQQASALISSTLKVAMLPYAHDVANAQMAMNFSDGSKANFVIPQASYGIALEVRGFKKVRSKKISKPGRDWMLYPAFIGLTVYEPAFKTTFFSQGISPKKGKDFAATWVTKNRTGVDEFALYSESLKKIIITGLNIINEDEKTSAILAKCR